MDAFFEGLIKAKVPKIAILAILFWAGVALINNSSELFSLSGITGLIIILIGVLLSMISFLDYRYKDSVDNAIAQLDKAIDSLARDPRPPGYKKLQSSKFDNLYRIREGDWRILYSIHDDQVLFIILDVRRRDQAYRDI